MAVGHAYAMQGKHSHLGEAVAHILSLIQHEPPPGDGRQGAVCDEIALGMPQGMSRTAGAPSLMYLRNCLLRGYLLLGNCALTTYLCMQAQARLFQC